MLLTKGPHKPWLPLADCGQGLQHSSMFARLQSCGNDLAPSGSAWPLGTQMWQTVTVSSATLTPKTSTPLLSCNALSARMRIAVTGYVAAVHTV